MARTVRSIQTVIWLGDTRSHDPRIVGPKAAHLSQLTAAFRVPPGFCLSAEMYRQAAPVGRVSSELRALIAAAYQELAGISGEPEPRVAVRSSAVDEDGPLASFAGQHETLLNIVGIDALVEAIEQSWTSAHNEQAISYRLQHGLATDDIGLAVLVQQMVIADVAGVMFSANPVNDRRDQMIVSASWGLGESIVGGTVTPDNWVVCGESFEILEESLGDKQVMTVAIDGGTQEVPVPRLLRSAPSLSGQQVQEVARLGKQLEARQGWPVDIEFAFAADILYLLQCRPITTLGQDSLALSTAV